MSTCKACGATNPPGRVRCVRCGSKLPVERDPSEVEDQDSGFQAVGSVELKKAKTGLAGLMSWRKKPGQAAPPGAAPGQGPAPANGEGDELVDGFQASMWDQISDMGDQSPAPAQEEIELDTAAPVSEVVTNNFDPPAESLPAMGEAVEAHHVVSGEAVPAQSIAAKVEPQDRAYTGGRVVFDADTVLIGAPPLTVLSPVPEIIRAISKAPEGLIATLSYGMKAPRTAQRQRERVRTLSTQLSKLRKKEQEMVTALGRAAQVHGMSGSGAGRESSSSEPRSTDGLSAEETRLVELGHQHENMAAHVKIAQRTLSEGEQRLASLKQRELELRNPLPLGTPEAEVAQHLNEFERVKAERAKAEKELEKLQEKVAGARVPLQRLKEEIDQLRQGVQSANKQRMVSRAKAARAAAKAGEPAPTSEQELGQSLLDGGGASPALRQLVVSAEASRRRVARWEDALERQQAELNEFDERRARTGFWMLMGGLLGGLVFVLISGEIVRRLLLSLSS